MGFSPAQRSWLETAQNKSADFAKANEIMAIKAKELETITGKVEDLREKMATANKELKVKFTDDVTWKNFMKRSHETTMDWMNGDRSSEVDTKHDLTGDYNVDPSDAKKVMDLHREMVLLQEQMESLEHNGKPVFTAKDIERELWSPLVRADIIPSNAVADKYSQEAQVFNGACEIYKGMLEDHTKTASRHETAQRLLRIGMDTVTMMGTIAGESIKAANFDASFISQSEKRENAKDLKALELEQKKPKPDPKKVAALTKKTEAFKKRSDDALKVGKETTRNQALVGMAVTLVNGGLSLADNALEKKEKGKNWKIAEKVYDIVSDSALGGLDIWAKSVAVDNAELAGQASFKTTVALATNLTKAGLKSGKVVFRIHEVVEAKDPAGQRKAALALIGVVADVIANSFAAMDKKSGKDSEGNDVEGNGDEFARIGVFVKTAILGSANAGDVAAQIILAKKEGKSISKSAIFGSLGLSAMNVGIVGAFKEISDSSRQVKDQSEQNIVSETETGRNLRKGAEASAMNTVASKMPDLNALMAALPPADSKELQDKLALIQAEQEAEQKQAEISAFQKSLEDPAVKQKFIDDVKSGSDAEVEALEKLIDDAMPSPDDLEDEEKAKLAMESVEKLIKEAAACNMRWKVLTGLANGGVSVLVAALPVAGLAASLTRMATDVAILLRKSYHVNRWRKNMAMTYGNSSVYGPAIKGRLDSAIVQVSQQTVRVIFDAVGIAADGLKLADASGVGAAAGAVGHGLDIANNMARALTEYGFKMQKEAEIEAGWQLYKRALANPGDRKMARTAMRWNSTLSKCVLAYGIVMDGDPIAKEVGRSCGLTPEILADQKDVCPKVVKYFQTLYSDDPVVLRRVPITKDWHPGALMPSLAVWAKYKAAAVSKATPPLARESTATAAIDQHLATLGKLIGANGDYAGQRDKKFPEDELNLLQSPRATPEYQTFLESTETAAESLVQALRGYKPVMGPCPADAKVKWNPGMQHSGMVDIAVSLTAQADMILGEVRFDLGEFKALSAKDENEDD